MTTSPGTGWDDDRLAAAFRARSAGAPTPASLAGSTIAHLRQQPASPRWWPALRPVAALIAVAVVAAAGLTAMSARREAVLTPSFGTSSLIPPSRSPGASATADQALGLPIISVSEAIAIRDAGVDDREIAVRGWFSPTGGEAVFCPLMQGPVIHPVQLVCPDYFVWLTQERETTVVFGGDTTFKPPVGPALHPSFDQVDQGWMAAIWNPRSCARRTVCPVTPGSIVAIGHFDDRRATLCAPRVVQQCRDRFVVDRVDSVSGEAQPMSVIDGVTRDQVWTIEDVERIDEAGASILSMTVVPGRDGLARVEPSLGGDAVWTAQRAIWVVRSLVDGRVSTDLIPDGSQRVYEMLPDGTARFVRGSQP
jgi:hypothetical protein